MHLPSDPVPRSGLPHTGAASVQRPPPLEETAADRPVAAACAPCGGSAGLHDLPPELLRRIGQLLPLRDLDALRHSSERLHAVFTQALPDEIPRRLRGWTAEAERRLAAWPARLHLNLAQRAARLCGLLEFLGGVHRAYGHHLQHAGGPPQRWQLLRLALLESKFLAAQRQLDHGSGQDFVGTPAASDLLDGMQAFLRSAPNALRVRADPERAGGPLTDVSLGIQNACLALVRQCVQGRETRLNALHWVVRLGSHLQATPDHPFGALNLAFLAGFAKLMDQHTWPQFVAFMRDRAQAFPLPDRLAVANQLQDHMPIVLGSPREQDALDALTLEQIARLLADDPPAST